MHVHIMYICTSMYVQICNRSHNMMCSVYLDRAKKKKKEEKKKGRERERQREGKERKKEKREREREIISSHSDCFSIQI